MSITNAVAPYRRHDRRDPRAGVRVPVVMPLVEVDVDQAGYLDVRLDREPYCADGALTRTDLHRVLDDIATDLDTPIRVEVREADGSTFTDIITPRQAPPDPSTGSSLAPSSAPSPGARPPGAARTALASAFGISADGFTAGEPVEVCVIVAHQIADDDGTTHLRLPPALLQAHPRVFLLGRASGVVALSDHLDEDAS